MLRKDSLKVLFVSAEVAPFSKAGGLSQVSYFLPNALRNKRVDIRIFTPKYGNGIEDDYKFATVIKELKVPTDTEEDKKTSKSIKCSIQTPVRKTARTQTKVYLLQNDEYFGQRSNVYGYNDDHIRFGLFSRAVLEFIESGEFVPDVVHCNDWHAGYAINYLAFAREHNKKLSKLSLLLSIHNTIQGPFEHATASSHDFDDGKGELANLFSDRFYKQNGLKRGVMHADIINTVSDRFSRELLREEYGAGLHDVFKESRAKMTGILNGLDYIDFNPKTDKVIKKNYSSVTAKYARAVNKLDLQKEFVLNLDPTKPIVAVSGRLDDQKGADLIMKGVETLLSELEIQLIVLGTGPLVYIDFFKDLEKKHPGKVGTHLMSDFILPRKIFSGADMLLMPSKYEPGGIVAIEALRYGAVPIVRETGGLADIVHDYKGIPGDGNGFVFKNYTPESLMIAVARAVQVFKQKDKWNELVSKIMKQNFSWDSSANQYIELYDKSIQLRNLARKKNKLDIHQQPVFGELSK